MASLIQRYAEKIGREAANDFLRSDAFKAQIRKHVRWSLQGFEPGYSFADRERFTQTVADRIHEKAREPVYLFGYRIWRKRMAMPACKEAAEGIVDAFLTDEKIKFGDARYSWRDGFDLADADMEYWEACS